MLGVCIGSMALIVVLSVFNGFQGLVTSLVNSFTPEIVITVKEGKTFEPGMIPVASIKSLKDIAYYTEILEENALLKYKSNQNIATIRGVDDNFIQAINMDTLMVSGNPILSVGQKKYSVLGYGIAYALSVNINDEFTPISVSVPRKGTKSYLFSTDLIPDKVFNKGLIYPSGLFTVQQDIDDKFIIAPIDFVRDLLNYKTKVSAIQLTLNKNADLDNTQDEVQSLVGDQFTVENRYQQNKLIYQIMETEKWAVYLILSFILLIAAFNIIGSLTMLIIDKKKDISILSSLGMDKNQIRKIFLIEGFMVSFAGAIIGIGMGAIICLLQQQFHFIKLDETINFVIKHYPIEMRAADFALVIATVLFIGFIAAWYPAQRSTKNIQLPSV